MPLLINQTVVTDEWVRLDADQLEANPELPEGKVIVPFTYFLANQDALAASEALGVCVNGDDDIVALREQQQRFAVIAIDFPVLRDGRGFSIARYLARDGFKGQIRAVGDVSRDRLGYMDSCGFTAYELSEDRFTPEDVAAFTEMSVNYQGSVADPRPIFRR
ncbi:DUF934 domain-containing protein [Neptunomonas sp. XY-337]|uniref:DUF934 domain-containing protein n=1 Tax=Neptunomonas sp. XY-337 TaxID=2561897 RepID=UPI0010AA69A3|nr:DUF934 domain-containing protein [Neptunomonas sp. XY-337]